MRLRAALLVLLAPAVAWGQPVGFSLVSSPGAASDTAFPNTTWADTPYENAPPTYPNDDDWSLGGGADVELYLVPDDGATFGAIDATVTWDPALLTLSGVDESGGLFGGPDGTLFWTSPGGGELRINASRLNGENITAGSGDYAARIAFDLVTPGFVSASLSALDVRTFDGVGGQQAESVTTTDGAVRAYLGDVAAVGDASTGDGAVDFEDLTVFASGYYSGTAAVGGSLDRYKVKLDIGPTADGTVYSAPQPDAQIEFEDLVIFALSYARSQQGVYPRLDDPTPVELRLGTPVAEGADLLVPILVDGAADLRAFAFEVALDPGWEVVDATVPGGEEDRMFLASRFTGDRGFVDGAVLSGPPLGGDVAVVVLHLRSRSGTRGERSATPASLIRARLRTSTNVPVPVALPTAPQDDGGASLSLPHPNPVRGQVAIPFELAEAGAVVVTVLDALGREVVTVVDAVLPAGTHLAQWGAGDVSPGMYHVRLEAGQTRQARPLTILP